MKKEGVPESHARRRSQQARHAAQHARLTLGFNGEDVPSMEDVIAELQLIGHEDTAEWMSQLERLANRSGREGRCSNDSESAATLVEDADAEDAEDAVDAPQQQGSGHIRMNRRGQHARPGWRDAWYIGVSGWPNFTPVEEPNTTHLGRIAKATHTILHKRKA